MNLIHWKDEPDFRGTYSILASCMGTLSICVWHALHLDIPGRGESGLKRTLDKVGWFLIGLLAPELLLWVAFQELQAAVCLTLDARRVLNNESDEPSWAPHWLLGLMGKASGPQVSRP